MKPSPPSSVYRLQLSSLFSLKDATALIPYLSDLGIEGIYCSPIFESASDSGYDITNPNQLRASLGTEKDFQDLCSQLQKYNMVQILDIVPNHMGIRGNKNSWWLSVLTEGKSSPYASFFDIYWEVSSTSFKGKILLPILRKTYEEALINQDLSLIWENGFWIRYLDYILPLAKTSYEFILEIPFVKASSMKEKNKLLSLLTCCKEIADYQQQLSTLYNSSKRAKEYIHEVLSFFNGRKEDPQSFNLLHELLERQSYRLAHWVMAGQEVTYRRFFAINDLIAIHIEKEEVFTAHHRWIMELLQSKEIYGVRIDHSDGLYRSSEYFKRIRELQPSLIITEKILSAGETLPDDWPIDGTVGYDFLCSLNGLFIQTDNEQSFDAIYEDFLGSAVCYPDLLYQRKEYFLKTHLGSELRMLTALLWNLTQTSRLHRDFSHVDLQEAMQAIIASFPTYRTYVDPNQEIPCEADREYIILAIETARKRSPRIAKILYDYIKQLLLLEIDHTKETSPFASDFILHFQQLTVPCMAKGLEDSIFLLYNRLIALCDVGCDPQQFGSSKQEFHEFNKQKLKKWPLGFISNATHDSKYSEDVRMRLCVLSEIPKKWQEALRKWEQENQKYKTRIGNALFPDKNTEYYLYQILLGIWPISSEEAEESTFRERMDTCVVKMLREVSIYTSWNRQNKEYEQATHNFLFSLLMPREGNDFYSSFLSLQRLIHRCGCWNSLSGLVMRIGSCGIVDLYQGNESWNYLWMDPDNRAIVDYDVRKTKLYSEKELKLFITRVALNFRKRHRDLFLFGDYIPLQTSHLIQENIIAFSRILGEQKAIIITGRFFTQLPDPPIGKTSWQEARLILPREWRTMRLTDIFTCNTFQVMEEDSVCFLLLADVFAHFPLALLTPS